MFSAAAALLHRMAACLAFTKVHPIREMNFLLLQVTRDWLLMEMGDIDLNDSMFADIADAAYLPDSCRPQV